MTTLTMSGRSGARRPRGPRTVVIGIGSVTPSLGPSLEATRVQGVAHPLFGEFAFAGATRAVLRPETNDLAPTHLSDEGVGARRGPDDAELDGGTRCLGELRQVDVAQRIERLDLGAEDRQVYGRSERQQRLPAQ